MFPFAGKCFPLGEGFLEVSGGLSRIHASEGSLELRGAGFYHSFGEAEGKLCLAGLQLQEDGFDEVADGWEGVMDAFAAEIGVEGRWDDLDDLDIPRFQEIAEGERKGAEKGFCGGIDRHFCQRDKSESGCDIHNGGEWPMLKEEVGQVEGGFDIDGYLLLGPLEEVFIVHGHPVLDAGVVDQDVALGMVCGYPRIEIFAAGGVFEIAFSCNKPGVLRRDLFQ